MKNIIVFLLACILLLSLNLVYIEYKAKHTYLALLTNNILMITTAIKNPKKNLITFLPVEFLQSIEDDEDIQKSVQNDTSLYSALCSSWTQKKKIILDIYSDKQFSFARIDALCKE